MSWDFAKPSPTPFPANALFVKSLSLSPIVLRSLRRATVTPRKRTQARKPEDFYVSQVPAPRKFLLISLMVDQCQAALEASRMLGANAGHRRAGWSGIVRAESRMAWAWDLSMSCPFAFEKGSGQF